MFSALIISLFVAYATAEMMEDSSLRIISDSIRDFSSRFSRVKYNLIFIKKLKLIN